MASNPTLDEVGEQLALLLHELHITGELLVETLEPTVQELKTGRSPQALRLDEKIQGPSEYLQSLGEIYSEFKIQLEEFSRIAQGMGVAASPEENRSGILGELPQLQKELNFWNRYRVGLENLMSRLKMIEGEFQLSALGRVPIEEAWEKIEALAQENS